MELFTCPDCSKTFESRGKLNRHSNTHSKPHRCETCDKGFGLRADLSRHVKARHRLGNAMFKCEIASCKSTFARKDNIRRHIQKYHPNQSKPDRQSDPEVALPETSSDGSTLPVSLNATGETLLMQHWWQMAAIGNIAVLQILLEAGCDININAGDGNTALHCAAQAGQLTAVEFLIEHGAQINLENLKRQTPLLAAAISGRSDTILILLRAGGTVARFSRNTRYAGSSTPAFADYIVATGDPDLIQAILDMDTPQLIKGREAKAAGLVAAAARIGQTPVLESLASSDQAAFTPFRKRWPIFFAVSNGHLEAVRTMMALTGLSEDSKSLPSLVCTAARRGHLDILRLLLESFPSALNRQNYSKQSALHSAASKKRLSSVLYLLSFPDIDVNQEEGRYRTALHLAVLCGAIDVVRALIAHPDIDLNRISMKYSNIGTALQMAAKERHLDVVQALLLCPGIDTSPKSGKGTALFLAARSGSLEISRALLEHGARDDTALFPTFWTGLHLARLILQYDMQQLPSDAENIVQSRAQLAEFLFHAKGYQYHEVSKNGVHLVSLAAKENDADLLRVLLNLDSITPDGLNEKMNYERFPWYYRTPLNYAKSRGYTEIADLLASHGAIDEFYDPYGDMAAQEKEEALKLAAKNDESSQPAQEQPPLSEASRETPEVASQEEYDSDSELEQEPYSYIDEYISPHSNEDESERESKRQRRELASWWL